MTSRPTCADLGALKGKRQILTVHVDNEEDAVAAAEAGMDMFTFEVDARRSAGGFHSGRLSAALHGFGGNCHS